MKLSFHGADRDVTGSCHRIELAGLQLLVDCGMFQGGRELDAENAEPLGFNASRIDAVLLTHAHLDHCGRLPLLFKAGFRGEIICTAPTAELTRIVLNDSARIAEEDAARASRRRGGAGAVKPLYTREDVEAVLKRFGRVVGYNESIALGEGVTASFHDAGHILGSASVLLQVEEGGRRRRLLLSGDIGNRGRPILRDPAPPEADIVLMETTYGDRQHRSVQASVDELIEAIDATLKRHGNVVIPSFALERTQEILYYLREATESGRLPRNLPVFLDSPMAVSTVEVYRRYPEFFDENARAVLANGSDPFGMPGLRMTREHEDSMGINRIAGGAVIIAGSGMCTGGRVRHHLRHNLGHDRSAVIFVGFAARGTLARQIIDGARYVQLFGEQVPVRAHIHTINGFSAHADQSELLAWHAAAGGRERTILVHGEESVMAGFASLLGDVPVSMPEPGSELVL